MLDQLVFRVERLPSLLAALAILGIAGWLLWFDFQTRAHRALALLLVLKAFFVGLVAFGSGFDLAIMVRFYFAIAIPFAAAHLAVVLHAHYAPARRRRIVPIWVYSTVLAVGAAVSMLLYALRRDLFRGPLGEQGPLVLFFPLAYAAFAFIAFILGRIAMRAGTTPLRQSGLLLMAVALCLEPIHQSLFQILGSLAWIGTGRSLVALIPSGVAVAERTMWLLTIAFAIAFVRVVSQSMRDPEEATRRRGRRLLVLLCLPAITALMSLAARIADLTVGFRGFIDVHFALDALWVVAGAAIMMYGIASHHFLDERARVRRAVRTSTLVGGLLLMFFLAKELLEELLRSQYPIIPGLAAAVIAAVLLHPTLLLVDRFVRGALPAEARLSGLKLNQRKAVYRQQVEIVWMDGIVTRKERRLLERMRERLNLSEELARRIEDEVMGSAGPGNVAPTAPAVASRRRASV